MCAAQRLACQARRRTATGAAILLLSSLTATPAPTAAQSENSEEWQRPVVCPSSPWPDSSAAECKTEGWEVLCCYEDCRGWSELYGLQLAKATAFFDKIGFRRPTVRVRPGGCVAAISEDVVEPGHQPRAGVYYIESKRPKYAELHLRNPRWAAAELMYEGWHAGLKELITPSHEVFHGVTESYLYIDRLDDAHDWIIEGMADAAMATYAKASLGPRDYSYSLHEPKPSVNNDDAYLTGGFWMAVAERLDGSIKYFEEIFQLLHTEPLYRENAGLLAVDQGIVKAGVTEGLYDVLPWFYTRLDWNKQPAPPFPTKRNLGTKILPGNESSKTWTQKEQMSIRRAGAELVRFVADPGNRRVELEVTFAKDHEDLHLLVDNARYDHYVELDNTYRALLPRGEKTEVLVLVANIAKDVHKYQSKASPAFEDPEAQLEITLREVASCAMTAHVNGDLVGRHHSNMAHFDNSGSFEVRLSGFSMSDDPLEMIAASFAGFRLQAIAAGPLQEGFRGSVPLTLVHVVPGALAAEDLGALGFWWVQGAPAAAELSVHQFKDGVVDGSIRATLWSEEYVHADTRKPFRISVSADFVAFPGPRGCLQLGF